MKRKHLQGPALSLLLGLSGCVHTASVAPPGPGHPASAQSASVEFTPPANPYAMPLEPVSGGLGGAMDHGMDDMPGMQHDTEQPQSGAAEYVCPMHPDVRSSEPVKCPKCGMKLVPAKREDHHENGGSH